MTYGLALPLNRRYRGLVDRLPRLAWERLGLVVFWVDRDVDGVMSVTMQEHPGTDPRWLSQFDPMPRPAAGKRRNARLTRCA